MASGKLSILFAFYLHEQTREVTKHVGQFNAEPLVSTDRDDREELMLWKESLKSLSRSRCSLVLRLPEQNASNKIWSHMSHASYSCYSWPGSPKNPGLQRLSKDWYNKIKCSQCIVTKMPSIWEPWRHSGWKALLQVDVWLSEIVGLPGTLKGSIQKGWTISNWIFREREPVNAWGRHSLTWLWNKMASWWSMHLANPALSKSCWPVGPTSCCHSCLEHICRTFANAESIPYGMAPFKVFTSASCQPSPWKTDVVSLWSETWRQRINLRNGRYWFWSHKRRLATKSNGGFFEYASTRIKKRASEKVKRQLSLWNYVSPGSPCILPCRRKNAVIHLGLMGTSRRQKRGVSIFELQLWIMLIFV